MQQFRMTESEFQMWKEGNEWFWDLLRQIVEDHENGLDGIKEALISCPDSDVEELRRRSVAAQARLGAFEDMLGLTYEGVQDMFEGWREAA